HATDLWQVPLFENAHPPVVTFAADRVDLPLWVVNDLFRRISYFDAEWSEVLSPMNPCGPEMLLTSRWVVAEQAICRHKFKLSQEKTTHPRGVVSIPVPLLRPRNQGPTRLRARPGSGSKHGFPVLWWG